MSRTLLSLYLLNRSGTPPEFSDANPDGHIVNNIGHETFLWVNNNSESPIVVTVAVPLIIDGLGIDNRTVTVPADETRFIGPFPCIIYCKPNVTLNTPHSLWVDYSATADVQIAAVTLSNRYAKLLGLWIIGESKLGYARVG